MKLEEGIMAIFLRVVIENISQHPINSLIYDRLRCSFMSPCHPEHITTALSEIITARTREIKLVI